MRTECAKKVWERKGSGENDLAELPVSQTQGRDLISFVFYFLPTRSVWCRREHQQQRQQQPIPHPTDEACSLSLTSFSTSGALESRAATPLPLQAVLSSSPGPPPCHRRPPSNLQR